MHSQCTVRLETNTIHQKIEYKVKHILLYIIIVVAQIILFPKEYIDTKIFVFVQPIQDPDPFINCDLMDGRDAFLTMARERHYEFSSLRRAKYSSMAMLYELHNQGQDRFVYTCNNCKTHVETRYHCTVCDVSYICWIFFSGIS